MTTDTRFIAFYSYKGGVGRSLALSNLACLLAWHGRKVLILDLDLEAPGQHQTSLFRGSYLPGTPIRGILDLLAAYRAHQAVHGSGDEPPAFEWDLHHFIRRSTFFDSRDDASRRSAELASPGSIWLMDAGLSERREGYQAAYQAALANWDWDGFYQDRGEAFLQELRWRLRGEGFDDVLIDSRTGLSDVFYVATLSLGDTVICVSGLNHQNLEGTDLAVRTLFADHNRERYGDKRILLVLSPLPHGVLRERDVEHRLAAIRARYPHLAGWVAELPYVPWLALEETILVAESSDPLTSGDPYVQQIVRMLDALESKEESIHAAELEPEPSNPFHRARIEHWSHSEFVNHFVKPGGNLIVLLKQIVPTVVYGSRGTGKTALAFWFSYETQRYLLEQSGRPPGPDSVERIGLWPRFDIDLLNTFENLTDQKSVYTRLFGQFLDLLVLSTVLKALDALGGIGAWGDEGRILGSLVREIGIEVSRLDYTSVAEAVEGRMAEIRRYVNNPSRETEPYVVQGNVLMKLLVEELLKGKRFRLHHYFAVFIIEYENFHPHQQRVVNTRVKQVNESNRVTYKLLARHEGIKDFRTLAEDQRIEINQDFRAYSLDEDIDLEDFASQVKEVMQRYLYGEPWFARRGYIIDDLDRLFPGLSPIEEAQQLAERQGNAPLCDFIKENHGDQVAERLLPWMIEEPSLLRQAVAVVMLNQGELPDAVLEAMRADNSKARFWYQTYHIGTLFWLGSLYHPRGRQKLYTGLSDIVGVAGGNIRVALDLCHAIIERWLAEEQNHQVPITPRLQSDAICVASKGYLQEFRDRSEPQITRLVNRLGGLFEIIRQGPRQSAPEINHFVVKGKPDAEIDGLLHQCRAEGILRWLPETKQQSRHDVRRDAWQLHPRYAPAFNISWRRKKRLELTWEDLRLLANGSEEDWTAREQQIATPYCKIGPVRQ